MPLPNETPSPDLVSVIIPCYNHGKYLSEAIESILAQTYQHLEIVVVDDGSTDNSKAVAQKYEQVKYIYQTNQGLSAARNTGIDNSTGKYLVFLDADDLLFPDALSVNVRYLQQNDNIAFISGAYVKVNEKGAIIEEGRILTIQNYYNQLLHGNFIGMHATVMYKRWVFDFFRYDISLKACEDYDLYLKITRRYPVLHHSQLLAGYRIHSQNMSGNLALMLETALVALDRQKNVLENQIERKCLRDGIEFYKDYYCEKILYKLLFNLAWGGEYKNREEELKTIKKYHKLLYYKFIFVTTSMNITSLIKKRSPAYLLYLLRRTKRMARFVRHPQRIKMGDLNRITPFSTNFGYERGGPVDRYYIENFLQKNAALIHGRVLEIGDNDYTLRYGGVKITQSDILHINEENKKATIIGDLSNAPQIADKSFNCIILTQTLQFIYDYKEALHTCYRILKPGGALLFTVPGISHIDHNEWKDSWFWSFTQSSIKRVLSETFPAEKINVETFGNVLVATAFLYGLGLPELKKEQMDHTDPHYQVIIAATAIKPTT